MPSPSRQALITISDLQVQRGGRMILDHLFAEILRGQITSIIGLNGSGKSTLLRAILGEFPYRGSIIFRCGHDHSQPRPEYIGYVPQKLDVDARIPITVADLLGISLSRQPWYWNLRSRFRHNLKEMLKPVQAEHLLDVPVEGLSGGQLQRVLLALALHPNPELLLLDEPAAGIDFRDQTDFYEIISDMVKRLQVTVVLVSHDISMVHRVSHNVLCLRDGKIQCQGPPHEILTTETMQQTFGQDISSFSHAHHHPAPSA